MDNVNWLHLVSAGLLLGLGVIGLLSGVDAIDGVWLLLGLAHLVGGSMGDRTRLREYFTSAQGLVTVFLLAGAVILMIIELFVT